MCFWGHTNGAQLNGCFHATNGRVLSQMGVFIQQMVGCSYQLNGCFHATNGRVLSQMGVFMQQMVECSVKWVFSFNKW